jgi:hypothetical protein
LRNGLGLIAESDTDALGSMIQGEYSHVTAVWQEMTGVASGFPPGRNRFRGGS